MRAAALMLVGAIAVHEGRYMLTPPEHVHGGLHGYLAWLAPLIGLVALLAVAEFGARLARRPGEGGLHLPGGRVLFAVFTFVLLTLFGLQETLELTIADGALPADNVFIADGGWVSIPLALAAAAALALILRGAVRIASIVAARLRQRPRRAARSDPSPPQAPLPWALLLARSLAPRGPPLLS